MSPQTLKRLNKRLGDLRGNNPWGQPLYRWFHSRELTYPCRTSERSYEHARQIDEDRWLIAKWQPPIPEREWIEQFPLIGYPHQGCYYATDIILSEGIEPNDTITDEVSGRIKAFEHKTFRECLDDVQGLLAQREHANRNRIADVIDDAVTAYGNIPGARGGSVSFGGIGPDKVD